MAFRRRARSELADTGFCRINGTVTNTLNRSAYAKLSETTVDESSTGWPIRNQLLKYTDSKLSTLPAGKQRDKVELVKNRILLQDYGGSFWSEKTKLSTTVSIPVETPFSTSGSIVGPVYHLLGSRPNTSLITLNDQTLFTYGFGSRAIKKTAPTAPEANLAQGVAELREGLPKMLGVNLLRSGSLRVVPKNAAGEYLNYQFGIAPIISDVKQLSESVIKSRSVTEQLLRDNGRLVRRRLEELPLFESATTTVSSGSCTPYSGAFVDSTMPIQYWTTRSTRRWFSGAFRYKIPDMIGSSFLDKLEKYEFLARRHLGLTFDASTAWEVTRFSWLVDWFIDFGSVLSAISVMGHDKLTLHHGYCMSEVDVELISSSSHHLRNIPHPPLVNRYYRNRKVRVKASPFGFDVDLNALSLVQNGILAALGISKAPQTILPQGGDDRIVDFREWKKKF